MSYDIYIGEAEVRVPEKEDLDEGYNDLEVYVRGLDLPEAPHFPNDDMTGRSNSRHPGYGQWSKFTCEAGINELFFDKEKGGLMRHHPGACVLTRKDLQAISEAKARWMETHPKAVPGWCACKKCDQLRQRGSDPEHKDLDGVLARLIWLEWWIGWALEHCRIPTIYNH